MGVDLQKSKAVTPNLYEFLIIKLFIASPLNEALILILGYMDAMNTVGFRLDS